MCFSGTHKFKKKLIVSYQIRTNKDLPITIFIKEKVLIAVFVLNNLYTHIAREKRSIKCTTLTHLIFIRWILISINLDYLYFSNN